jgi:hypothetical protein
MRIKIVKPKSRNFEAKHARNMPGAGAHVPKQGQHSTRLRQKNQWKREAATDF